MPTIAELIIGLRGDTKNFDRKMRETQARLKSVGQSVTRVTALVGAFGAAIGIKAVREFTTFNKAMTASTAIMKGATANLKEMDAAARETAKTTTFSAKQSADAFFFLASAGLNAQQSIAALPQVAAFATAGQFDLARATDLVTDAQSALGLSTKNAEQNLRNMTRVTDVLVKANTLANASVEQFSESLTTKSAAAARAAGVEFEEVVGVLAAFADQGVKGAEAGTQFAIVLRDLQTKAIDNEKAFKDFRIEVFDANGNLNSITDTIGQLEDALEGMSAEQKRATLSTLGFTDKSIGALQALLGLSDKIRGYREELKLAAGTTKQIADKQLTSLSAKFDILKSRVNDLFLEIGNRLAPALEKLIPIFERMVDAIQKVVVGFVDLTQSVDKFKITQRFSEAQTEIEALDKRLRTVLSAPAPDRGLVKDLEGQLRSLQKESAKLLAQLARLSGDKGGTGPAGGKPSGFESSSFDLPEDEGAGGGGGAAAIPKGVGGLFPPEVVARIQSAAAEIAKILDLQTRFNEVVEQTNQAANDLWFNWAISAGEAFAQIKIGAFDLFQQFTAGFGDAIASAIVFGEDFATLMNSLFKNVLATLISTIIQFLIELVVAKIIAAAITAGFHIGRVAQELQIVYLAAFAATAAIPIIGPALAPGAAGAAVAAAAAGSIAAAGSAPAVAAGAVGAAEGGLTLGEGLVMLHPNELITPVEKVPGLFGGDQRAQELNIFLDNRLLARKVISGMPREVALRMGTT